MTFLPIVGRELAVAARRRGTYWLRSCAAVGALGLFFFAWLANRGPIQTLGHTIFTYLGSVVLTFSLLSGVFLTADSLAAEKREGTLGLLFLTDLKGFDVVLGKLAASSLQAVYGLLAVFPILALPLLTGGLAPGEFWRTLLVFVATMYFSLSIGMWISAASHDGRQAIITTLVAITVLTGVLPALWQFGTRFPMGRKLDFLLWPSPVYAYVRGIDASFARLFGPGEFWAPVATILGIGTAAIVAASLVLPKSWQKGPDARSSRPPAQAAFPLSAHVKFKLPWLLTERPFYWLALRLGEGHRALRPLLFLTVPLLAIFMIVSLDGTKNHLPTICAFFTAMGIHVVAKIMMAYECTRRFNHDRQSGAMELLLATPLREQDIVSGQRQALWTRFKHPLCALGLINAAMMVWVFTFSQQLDMSTEDQWTFGELLAGGLVVLIMDFQAMVWTGMWNGLNAKNQSRAMLRTVLQVLAPSWLMIFFLIALIPQSAGRPDFLFAVWFGLGIVVDFINIGWARRHLSGNLRAILTKAAGGSGA